MSLQEQAMYRNQIFGDAMTDGQHLMLVIVFLWTMAQMFATGVLLIMILL